MSENIHLEIKVIILKFQLNQWCENLKKAASTIIKNFFFTVFFQGIQCNFDLFS